MWTQNSLQQLIGRHYRRLQKLKEKEALQGNSADPSIGLEIEEIEKKIKFLQDELNGIKDEPRLSFLDIDWHPETQADFVASRVLKSIKSKITKAYSISFDLEYNFSEGDEEGALYEERLKALLESIHVHVLYALENILQTPLLLADYKTGFEPYKNNLTEMEIIPALNEPYPVVLDYMSPYVDLISTVIPVEPETPEDDQGAKDSNKS